MIKTPFKRSVFWIKITVAVFTSATSFAQPSQYGVYLLGGVNLFGARYKDASIVSGAFRPAGEMGIGGELALTPSISLEVDLMAKNRRAFYKRDLSSNAGLAAGVMVADMEYKHTVLHLPILARFKLGESSSLGAGLFLGGPTSDWHTTYPAFTATNGYAISANNTFTPVDAAGRFEWGTVIDYRCAMDLDKEKGSTLSFTSRLDFGLKDNLSRANMYSIPWDLQFLLAIGFGK